MKNNKVLALVFGVLNLVGGSVVANVFDWAGDVVEGTGELAGDTVRGAGEVVTGRYDGDDYYYDRDGRRVRVRRRPRADYRDRVSYDDEEVYYDN